jgi:hypothetical protein
MDSASETTCKVFMRVLLLRDRTLMGCCCGSTPKPAILRLRRGVVPGGRVLTLRLGICGSPITAPPRCLVILPTKSTPGGVDCVAGGEEVGTSPETATACRQVYTRSRALDSTGAAGEGATEAERPTRSTPEPVNASRSSRAAMAPCRCGAAASACGERSCVTGGSGSK